MIKLRTLLKEEEILVFRGDDDPFPKFDYSKIGKSTGADTVGFWFTDSSDAAEFYGQHVRKFKINLFNPMHVTSKDFVDHYPNGPSFWAQTAMQKGHDGVIIHDITDGDRQSTVYCVFDDSQIEFSQ